jgi:hypothetical protein
MVWGRVDDEALAEARSLIGVPLRRDTWRWVGTATRDAISHFAEGMGDANPLWNDIQYGKECFAGTNLAPPCFLYAVDGTTVAPKLAGVQWIYAACDWLWNDRLWLNDEFKVNSYLLDVEEKSTRFAQRWAMQTGRVNYLRNGTLVAQATAKIARTPRGAELHAATGGKPKYETRPAHHYTQDEMDRIEKEALAEPVRGRATLHCEDIQVGDELPAVVKGPLTGTDIVGWYSAVQGARPYGGTHELVYKYRQRHADYHLNSETGARDSAGRGHLEVQTGVDVGMGGAYDIGPQRIAWASHAITNWMGDEGFLHRLNIEVRRPNLLGDTTWWRGKIAGVVERDGYSVTALDMWADNQLGERTAWGAAEVLLPSRKNGPVKLPIPVASRPISAELTLGA